MKFTRSSVYTLHSSNYFWGQPELPFETQLNVFQDPKIVRQTTTSGVIGAISSLFHKDLFDHQTS